MRAPSTRMRGTKYDPQANEHFNRLDWWLREYGHPPTREALIAMREVSTNQHYRVPKKGTSVTSQRIAKAVDNDEWQRFRYALKGVSTEAKLYSLKDYWNTQMHGHVIREHEMSRDVLQYGCDICIQVDNYIKALCRGGQLYPGESLYTALQQAWKLRIKR